MIELMVKATNEKIEETFDAKGYSQETLKKSPYIDFIDEVNNLCRRRPTDCSYTCTKPLLYYLHLCLYRYCTGTGTV